MKNIILRLNTFYIRFERWFEKQFGWFFTNAEKAEDLRKLEEK